MPCQEQVAQGLGGKGLLWWASLRLKGCRSGCQACCMSGQPMHVGMPMHCIWAGDKGMPAHSECSMPTPCALRGCCSQRRHFCWTPGTLRASSLASKYVVAC